MENFCEQGQPFSFIVSQLTTACDDEFCKNEFVAYVMAFCMLAMIYLIVKETRNFNDYVKLLQLSILTSVMFIVECLIYQFRAQLGLYIDVHFWVIQLRYLMFFGINLYMMPFLVVAALLELFLFLIRETIDKLFPRIIFMSPAEEKKSKSPPLGFTNEFLKYSARFIGKKLAFCT